MTTPSVTISGLGQSITLSITTGYSGSPMPTIAERKKQRATVQNEPIQTEYDIGQDMGKHSDECTISGLCSDTQKVAFEALADTPQFPSAQGSIDISYVGMNQPSWSMDHCVIKSFTSKPYKGSPFFYEFSAQFIQFGGQS